MIDQQEPDILDASDSTEELSRREQKDARLYDAAIEMLKRGMSREKLTLQLAEKQNVSAKRAKAIVDQVWEDQKGVRRTNVIILFVVTAIFIGIGLAVAILAENLPLSTIPAGFGCLLGWEAIKQFRNL